MTDPFWPVMGAISISVASIATWCVLLFRILRSLARRHEDRVFVMAMPIVGLLASVGTLASAIGFGVASGALDLAIPTEALTLIASMGRGGLLMGGVIALAFYRPEKDHIHD